MKVRVWVLISYVFLNIFTVVQAQENTDLNKLKKNIEVLQKDIQIKKETKKNVGQTLEQTKAALHKNEQELGQINDQQQKTWQELQQLRNQLATLSTTIQNNKAQIARLLNNQYKTQQSEAIVLLLKNSNPNQKGRDLSYVRYIAQANQSAINALREQQIKLSKQEAQINLRLKTMDQILLSKRISLQKLKIENAQALKNHQKISQDIILQDSKLNTLKGNERRLTSVIHSINKKSITPPTTPAIITLEKEEDTLSNQTDKTVPKITSPTKELNEPIVIDSFSQKRGTFKLPTRGKVIAKFGTLRTEGSTWKGIVIEAPEGQAVQSIAAGKIAYASSLQGYGNTVIVDHGNNHLSIYTGLSSISVFAGNQINARTILGNTGQLESGETGLYFEIRYLSQPMNPLSWIN